MLSVRESVDPFETLAVLQVREGVVIDVLDSETALVDLVSPVSP